MENHNSKNNYSKGIYIHIPFCLSKCKYCDFFSIPCDLSLFNCEQRTVLFDDYIEAVCNEILYRCTNSKDEEKFFVDTIYIGGGTPSLLSAENLKKIILFLKNSSFFDISDDCEITVEINPDDVSHKLLADYLKAGVTRISCGLQSMNEKALSFEKRRSSVQMNQQAIKLLSEWPKDLSVDFICGLPYETKKTFLDGLDYVIQNLPNLSHISMYSLTIEEETPLGKEISSGAIDYDYEFSDELWICSRDFLEKNGFEQYEVSNFSKKHKQCKHNLKYWNHEDYFGIGSGACGTIYNQNGEGIRWTNVKDIKKYMDFWLGKNNYKKNDSEQSVFLKNQNKKLPQECEKIDYKISSFEYFMMGLRKISGISQSHYKSVFNSRLPQCFIKLCKEWEKKDLCIISNEETYTLGKKGILFLNTFLENLMLDFNFQQKEYEL